MFNTEDLRKPFSYENLLFIRLYTLKFIIFVTNESYFVTETHTVFIVNNLNSDVK